jgi:hypothetical protein
MSNTEPIYDKNTYIGYLKLMNGGMRIIPGDIDTKIINNRDKILEHLHLVFSGGKKLKEKNLEKYFKALGGKYMRQKLDKSNKIEGGSHKVLYDTNKLIELSVKKNHNMDKLFNLFKDSAPQLYDKLDRVISISGGTDSEPGTINELPEVEILTGYTNEKLIKESNGYAFMDFEFPKLDPSIQKFIDERKKNGLDERPFLGKDPNKPETWDLKLVLEYLSLNYKKTHGYYMLYSSGAFDKDEFNGKISMGDFKINIKIENGKVIPTAPANETLAKYYGSDGLLISLYTTLLVQDQFNRNLLHFLIYWFYYAGQKSVLNTISWIIIAKDGKDKGKPMFNPTARLVMRLIEVLNWVNHMWLLRQCNVKKNILVPLNCNKSGECDTEYTTFTRLNKTFLNKLKIQLGKFPELEYEIKSQMSAGQFSILFRQFIEFKNFKESKKLNKDVFYDKEKRYDIKKYSCEEFLRSNNMYSEYPGFSPNWFLYGIIKITSKGGYDREYYPEYNRGGYDREYYPEYNRGGYDREYYPEYNRGGYDREYSPEYNRGGYDREYSPKYNRGGYRDHPRRYDRVSTSNMYGGNIKSKLRLEIENIQI